MTCSPKNLRKIPIFSRVIIDLDEPCGKLRNFRVHPVDSRNSSGTLSHFLVSHVRRKHLLRTDAAW